MVYKKYIKRGNKLHGPYYYESYRDENGKIKKRYVGTSLGRRETIGLLSIIGLVLAFSIVALMVYQPNFSVVEDLTDRQDYFGEGRQVLFSPVCSNGVCELGEDEGNCATDCLPGVLVSINRSYVPLMTEQELIYKFNEYYYWTTADSCQFSDINLCIINSREYFVDIANRGYSTEYYDLFRVIRALTRLHQVTGNQSYLDEAKWFVDRMIAHSVPRVDYSADPRDDGFLFWKWNSTDPITSDGGQIQQLQAGRGITEFARYLKSINDFAWQGYAEYVRGNITNYWANKDNLGRPVCRDAGLINDPIRCVSGSADKQSKFALGALDIYNLTGEVYYVDRAREVMGNQKENYTKSYDGGVTWQWHWDTSLPQGTMGTSHSNRFPEMIIQGYEDGEVFDQSDLTRTVNTLLMTIWESDESVEILGVRYYPNLFKGQMWGYNLSGTANYKHGNVGLDWSHLGRYDQRVRELMDNLTYNIANRNIIEQVPEIPFIGDGGTMRNYQSIIDLITENLYQNHYLFEIFPSGFCNFNGICDSGETQENCFEDCIFGNTSEDYVFGNYLNFYQVRYGLGSNLLYPPVPEGLAQFTIGDAYDGLEQYIYVSINEIHGHHTVSRTNAPSEAVALNSTELDDLYGESTGISKDKLQRADIFKIHNELVSTSPELFLYGSELTYGVELNSSGDVVLDVNNKPTNDSPLINYQQGKTIVHPTLYNQIYPTRFQFNYNSPAVREYIIRYVLEKLEQSQNNSVFIDSAGINLRQIFEDGDRDRPLQYISIGTPEEQTLLYANQTFEIFREIKKRGNNPNIIKNGLYVHNDYISLFLDELAKSENFDLVDGIMAENSFWTEVPYFLGENYGLNGYLNWSDMLIQNNKKIVYAASGVEDNATAIRIWLWAHLVANNGTYLYMNSADYLDGMINYTAYKYQLGVPLEEPWKNGDVWMRKYQRGTIIFNVSGASGTADYPLNGTRIVFVEQPTCPAEICNNNFDEDCDGDIDEGCDLFYGMAVESVDGDANQIMVNTTGASYVLSRTGMEMWRRIDPAINDYNPRLVARLDFDRDIGTLSILSNDKRTAVIDSTLANFTFNSDSFFFVTAKQSFSYNHTNLIANPAWNEHFYLDGYYAIPGITEDYRDRMWTDGYGGSLHAQIGGNPSVIQNYTDSTSISMAANDGMGHMVYPPKKFDFENLYGTNARPFVYSYPNTASLLDNPDSLLDNLSQKGFGVILLWNSFYRPSCMNVAGNATHFNDEQYFPYLLNMSYPCNNTDPVPTWLPFPDAVGYEYRNITQMKSFVNKAHAKGFKVITYMAASDFHPELNRGGFHAHNQSIENTEIFMRAFQSEYNLDGWYFDNGGIHTGYYPGTNTSLLENYNFMKQVREDVGDEGIILHHDSVDVWGYWSGLRAVMVDSYATYSLTGETGMPEPQEPAAPDEPNGLYLRFYSSGYGISQTYGMHLRNTPRTLAISEEEKNRVMGENLRSVEWLYGSDEIWNASFKPAYDIAKIKYTSHPDVDWPIDPNTGWFRYPTNVQLSWITGTPGTSVEISWDTTDDSDTELTYTSNGVWWESIYDVPLGPDRLVDNETMTQQHSVVLRNLKENTNYEFRIRSRNRAAEFSNETTWGYVGNFTTGNGNLDSDSDGLTDEWEYQYFGNLAQGAGGDYDGDGFSNLFEYQNLGLNPILIDDSALCNYNGVCSGRENSLNCLHDCPTSDLVAYWSFDYGNGENLAGNEHKGLVQGAEFVLNGGYNGRGAFYLENDSNFQDDYILLDAVIPKVGYAPEAGIYNNFTITGWMKRNETGKWDYLTGGLSGGVSYTAIISDGRLLISYADSAKQQRTCYSSATITDTSWHHLAFVGANNADIKIYLDGNDVTSPLYCQQPRDNGGFNSSVALVEWIGKFYTYGFMKGGIDDVSVWKKALNNTEVCGIAGGEWNGTWCVKSAPPTSCGNSICEAGENYTSCLGDCKIYYASPLGGGDGLSETTPFQISDFWNVARPGYVLYLLDGVYNNSDSIIDPPSDLSGTSTNPITIKALNDGGVTIDGQGVRTPVLLNYNAWFVLEGFNAHNSSSNVISIWPPSFHNTVRRVVAWDSREGETTVFAVSAETVLEDCAGWGTSRKIFSSAGYGNDNVTFRRCWGRWEGSHAIGPKMAYEFVYNNYNALVENSIGTWDAIKMKKDYILTNTDGTTPWLGYAVGGGIAYNSTGIMCNYCNFTNYTVEAPNGIFSLGGLNLDKRANTRILGSLAYTQNSQKADSYSGEFYYNKITNLTIQDTVAYTEKNSSTEFATFLLYPPLNWQPNAAYILESSTDVRSRSYSAVIPTGSGNGHFYKIVQAGTSGVAEPIWPTDGGTVVDNSAIWQDMGLLNLNLINSTSITDGFSWIASGWSKQNFLNLAYSQKVNIFNSSEGAELCYRYVNGELTNESLWPWPMEQRIYDAMIEGGYATPVNVTSEIINMFGPIPVACGGSGIIVSACVDSDGDGFNVTSGGTCGLIADCDDSNLDINPSKIEICNFIDDNCNGETDESQLFDIGFCDKTRLRPVDSSNNLFSESQLIQYFDEHYFNKSEIYSKNNSLNWSLTPPMFDNNDDGFADGTCVARQYDLYAHAFALITMFEATGDRKYLEEARILADNMISIAVDYDPSWATPHNSTLFMEWANQWNAEHGSLKFWDASGCAVNSSGDPILHYRYQLNELQGMRAISRLARVMKENNVPGWEDYYNFAAQSISYYAMIGATTTYSDGDPRVDAAFDKRTHYIQNALDLYYVNYDTNLSQWAAMVAESLESEFIIYNETYLVAKWTPTNNDSIDTPHANRLADLFVQTAKDTDFFTFDEVRKTVNTFLFKIWESNPELMLDGNVFYPNLFRNFMNGSNNCSAVGSANPPYRLGTIGFGWNRLGRYDERVRDITQNITYSLVNDELIQDFPANEGCVSGNNQNYNFVTSFIAETLYDMKLVESCGNGICESGETCGSCSSDCGSCQTGNGNGGGGGGGGSLLVNFLFGNQNCSELWQCGSWSDCQNGTRTRSCYDIHACGTNYYRPQFEEFCGEQFISSEELLLIYGEIRWDIVLAVVVSFVGLSGIIVSIVIMILRRQNIQKKRQELLRNVAKSQE